MVYNFHVCFYNVEKIAQPDPEISSDIVDSFIGELKRKKKTFIHVNRNESTCREFISAFMTAAVEHVQSKESKLCLKSEEWLDGSRGFGPVDYSVHLEDFVLLVCEAKKEDFEKGAAQNIVQMHSAVEVNENIVIILLFIVCLLISNKSFLENKQKTEDR